ncbi:MAG TPA: low temperature requirement protein A [Acidimicrobiia bacterium]|nr:low temperature requirement protein A [Acidimicrobiia bacterium]
MGRPRHRRRVRDRGDRVAHVPRHRTGGSRDTPGGTGRARRETAVPLELFLDLVIVFAFTQVTSLLSADPSWTGVVDGLLLLSVLWWAWAGFARLTNAVDPEEGVVRIVILGAIGAMLVMSLAAPHAFGRDALTFAIAYVMVRALHVGLSGLEAREAPELRGETLRLVPNAAAAGALLLVAGVVDGGARLACWAAVALVSFLGPLLAGGRGWEISPAHFVERFGQVILIALGESVVAIGIGAQGLRLDGGVIAAALLGMTAVACLWWAYFDWVVYVARARLTEAAPPERAALARDVYSYLHFPMVGGIVLFAFGLKTALHGPRHSLDILPATALAGGLALYLIAHVALRLRIGGGLGRGRPVAALVLVACIPVLRVTSAVGALGVVAATCVLLITYEVLRHREPRALIRSRRETLRADDIRPRR